MVITHTCFSLSPIHCSFHLSRFVFALLTASFSPPAGESRPEERIYCEYQNQVYLPFEMWVILTEISRVDIKFSREFFLSHFFPLTASLCWYVCVALRRETFSSGGAFTAPRGMFWHCKQIYDVHNFHCAESNIHFFGRDHWRQPFIWEAPPVHHPGEADVPAGVTPIPFTST